MSGPATLPPDPSAIGGVPKAPFVFLPDPPDLFRRRAERFRGLASGNPLAAYLVFLGQVAQVQAALAADGPPPEPIPASQVAQAHAHGMPPLDRAALAASPALRATMERFFEAMAPVEMPAQAAAALAALRGAGPDALEAMAANVVDGTIPAEELAPHLYVAAAVQVHAAGLAATLDARQPAPVGTGVCPVCGGVPVSSMVVGTPGSEGARYAACSFCATLWNEVRVKCLVCAGTEGIGYREVEGDGTATVKAEVCDRCASWTKILYQNRNPSLDAVADDVASLGLDVLLRETEYRRAGFNPFLLGY